MQTAAWCPKCESDKDIDDFHWKNKEMGRRASWCKPCVNTKVREIYRRNPKAHIERKDKYRSERRKIAQSWIRDHLLKNPCVDCGEGDPLVLEFDHVQGKSQAVATLASSGVSLERLEEEVAKCEIRCANCHLRRHRKNGWGSPLTR